MSGLLVRNNRAILIGVETVYGQETVLSGALHALRVTDLQPKPIQGNSKELKHVRPWLGSGKKIRTELYGGVTFKCDMVSSKVPGTPPPYAAALRGAGMAETLLAAPVTGVCQAGSTATVVKLAAASSAVDDIYMGAKWTNTDNNEYATIISYDGAAKAATLDRPLNAVPTGTTNYSIGAFARYNPVSDLLTMDACTIYYYEDKVLHKLFGSRGNVKGDASSSDTGFYEFDFMGLYGGIVDATPSGVDFSGWVNPWEAGYGRTEGQFGTKQFTGGASGLQMSKFSFDMGQKASYRSVAGYQGINITERSAAGSITLDATTVADYDLWSLIKNNGEVAIGVEQPDINGGSVRIDIGHAAPTDGGYGEDKGITTVTAPFDCQAPVGNRDIIITCR